MAAPISLAIATALISILAVGVYDVLTNFEENGCEMTYMFKYPEYIEVPLKKDMEDFGDYRLKIYGEGIYANQIRNLNLKGIPVLFIPGNAGNHKQVRSLGSVSLMMSENLHVKAHFNYFVADFNEELSALTGGVLTHQTVFVHLCIKKILSLYSSAKSPPSSVVLVGHSMGGLLARALFTLPDLDHSLVNTIITQATPHQRPVVMLDKHLYDFYNHVNQYWRDHKDDTLKHVTVVSSGGGYRDIQVRLSLTSLDGIVSPDRAVSTSTMAIPRAWVSTDHLCAVWCRQMILLTKRALFDVVDKSTMQVSSDADMRMKVFNHHFLYNNGLPDYLTRAQNNTITLDHMAQWEITEKKLWLYKTSKVQTTQYIAVSLLVETKSNSIIVTSNLTNPDWICYCDIPMGQHKCSTCTSLSARSRLLPPLYSDTKFVRVSFKDLPVTNDTHIVIIIPAGQTQVHIVSDRYNSDERHLIYQLPNTYDSIISYPVSSTVGAAMLKISNRSSFYSLHLSGLALTNTAFTAEVVPFGCRRHSAESFEGVILRLNVLWSHEETYSFAGYGKEAKLPVKLQTGRPADYNLKLDASEPHLDMFLHPYCHYKLRLIVATQDTLGQAVRLYVPLLPGYVAAVLFLAVRGLIIAHSKGQPFNIKELSPADAMYKYGMCYRIIPTTLVLGLLIRYGPIAKLLNKLGAPEDDATSLMAQDVWVFYLPVFLYMCTWMAIYLQTFLMFWFLTVISYFGRLLAWIPEAIVQKLFVVQIVVSIIAIVSTFICGVLGLMLSSVMLTTQILHLLYKIGVKMDTQATHRKVSLLFPVLLMVNLQTLMSLGTFVAWLKHGHTTGAWYHSLVVDSSCLPGLGTSVAVVVLLFTQDTVIVRLQGTFVGCTLYTMTVLTLLYACETLFRLPIIISFAIITTTLPFFVSSPFTVKNTESKKGD